MSLVETSKMTRTRSCGSSMAVNSRQLEFGKDRIVQPAFFSITRWTGFFFFFFFFLEKAQTDLEVEYGDRQQEGHSPSTAFLAPSSKEGCHKPVLGVFRRSNVVGCQQSTGMNE